MAKFLDQEGLKILWAQIKNYHDLSLVEELENYASKDDIEEVINEAVKDLPSALQFKGVSNSLEDIENPKNGDIVVVGTTEYIYVEKPVIDEESGEPKVDEEGNPIVAGDWAIIGDEAVYATKDEVESIKENVEGIEALSADEILAICLGSQEEPEVDENA